MIATAGQPPNDPDLGTVLITGGAGFVGSHLVRALRLRGRHVVVYDLADELPRHVLEVATGTTGAVTHVRADVTDTERLAEVVARHDVRYVVNAAALLGEPAATRRPLDALRVNAEVVWRLCELARRAGTIRRVLTISSRSVYGDQPHAESLTEDSRPRPDGVYGGSKAAGDLGAELYREHLGVDVVVARITGPYGPGQRHQTDLLRMARAACEGRPYDGGPRGDLPREYTYVKDITGALLVLLDTPRTRHCVYNVSAGVQSTLTEVAGALRTALPDADLRRTPGSPSGAGRRATQSIQRLREEFGFCPRWSLVDGVGELVDWIRHGDYGLPV
ncbi:NAD-dependent epimerase/dehydratase family protein [Actinophytocola sp.]|uniref:NAD-dependent epimerase/dehydratase family protein n=1 Tax=Actinophytocola sp. TaxID=1872138 RepID=UPI003D6BF325